MKRGKIFVIMLVLLSTLNLACSPKADAQAFGRDAERLVGTWTEISGRGATLVLSANGSTSGWGWTHWVAINDKLVMTSEGRTGSGYTFSLSSDGRMLIIFRSGDSDGWMFRKN